MAEYKLNFPIETPEAYAFWESRHKLNRIKAIIAFSLDLDNANDNLRRRGYYRQYRKRYLELYKDLVANPDMNGAQFVLSDADDLWWDPKVPPAVGPVALGIKTNPVDATALEGTTATFSVEAKGGTAPYTYQWEYSLMLANWVDAAGATSQTYSPTADTSTDGLHYRCVVKDSAGASVTSGYGKLTMIPKLAWDAHPTTGTAGTSIDYSWKGGIAPYTVVVLNPTGTEHDRATHTSPYTLNTTNQPGGQWKISVSDSSNPVTTITETVQLADNPNTPNPNVTVQAYNDVAREGVDDAVFKITAMSGRVTGYQWQTRASATASWADIPGATTNTLTVTKPDSSVDGHFYQCVVTNHPTGFVSKTVFSNPVTLDVIAANAKPMWVNDSHQAAPWIPLHVSDTEWKLDNATVDTGADRYFAVWMVDPSSLDDDTASPPTLVGAVVTSFTSSDPTILSPRNFAVGKRGTNFRVLKTGQATLTATTNKGDTIKLYVGVGAPAVTP